VETLMKKSFWMILGTMVLSGGMCLAQSEQPSLAELAKENKAARKAVKTFTEADLPSTRANATETVTAASAAQAASAATSSSAGSTEKKDSAKDAGATSKDRPAVAELKKQAESYQQERDTWKDSAKRYEALLENETNDFRRQMYQNAIENDKKNTAFYQNKLDQAQTELVNMQKTAPSGAAASPSAQP
jgi:hypothetical protein